MLDKVYQLKLNFILSGLTGILFICTSGLSANGEELPSLPLQTDSPGTRRLLQSEVEGWENRDADSYERQVTPAFSGEYSFNRYFSVLFNQGFTDRVKSKSDRMRYRERMTAGINLSYSDQFVSGKPAVGFKLFLSEKLNHPPLEGESDAYYLIRGQLSSAVRIYNLEAGIAFIIQSETTSSFREGPDDEFRRHYQFELFFIWNWSDVFKIHLETAYREPYDKEIDLKVRFWHLYPGLSRVIKRRHNIGFSFIVPLRDDGYADRGLQIRYAFTY